MILYVAEFVSELSLESKLSCIILRGRNNNANLKFLQKKVSFVIFGKFSHPKAQTAVQNIQANGPFVLLYQLEPKRCVPLDADHMLLSDGGLFFYEFTDEDIHP